MGCLCCCVLHCQGRLASTKDQFCAEHVSQKSLCRVKGCNQPISAPNSNTCTLSEHRAAEKRYWEKEKATFQLKKRFEEQRQRQNPSVNPGWDDDHDEEDLNTGSEAAVEAVIENGQGVKKKSETVQAHFGRGCTHNRQLIIAPCGMILARETFYFSEAFSTVAVRLSNFASTIVLIITYSSL